MQNYSLSFRNLLRLAFLGFLILAATPAFATKSVSGPTVNEGILKIEMRTGLETDGESASREKRFRQTYLAEYGVTSWWATRVNFKVDKLHGMSADYKATEWENKFQIFREKEDGFNGAFKLVYSMADNDDPADSVELRLMADKKFGKVKQRFNLGFSREVGPDSGNDTELGGRWQMTTPIAEDWKAGVEWFGAFGAIGDFPSWDEQEHQLGPVVQFKATDTLSFESGYLFGISDAASDGLFKFFIKANF